MDRSLINDNLIHNPSDRTAIAKEPNDSDLNKTLVLCPWIKQNKSLDSGDDRSVSSREEEAYGLCLAISLDVIQVITVPIKNVRPSTLFGSGKLEEIEALIKSADISLVVVDGTLTPIQQRNLEKAWHVKILDRTGIILEIFGARARTKEGMLQVELAHLQYQKSRLVRSWTHLERQRGGVGFLGGPGETQIESDRRALQTRITRLESQIEKVKKTRTLHRKSRKKVPYPIVALVGYTNAGKSTLFNRLTHASVMAEDMLFATLDPTLREIELSKGQQIILSDTVGFISDLPTELVAAFRATLEEVVEADIILHVRDISHEDSSSQLRDVEEVLGSLDIDKCDERLLEVWNKIDLLDTERSEYLKNIAARDNNIVMISAHLGTGVEQLLSLIEQRLNKNAIVQDIVISSQRGSDINWLYEHCYVLEREELDGGEIRMKIRVPSEKQSQFEKFL